eukprot:8884325-Pyramimonas_sp.AAC.1
MSMTVINYQPRNTYQQRSAIFRVFPRIFGEYSSNIPCQLTLLACSVAEAGGAGGVRCPRDSLPPRAPPAAGVPHRRYILQQRLIIYASPLHRVLSDSSHIRHRDDAFVTRLCRTSDVTHVCHICDAFDVRRPSKHLSMTHS